MTISARRKNRSHCRVAAGPSNPSRTIQSSTKFAALIPQCVGYHMRHGFAGLLGDSCREAVGLGVLDIEGLHASVSVCKYAGYSTILPGRVPLPALLQKTDKPIAYVE